MFIVLKCSSTNSKLFTQITKPLTKKTKVGFTSRFEHTSTVTFVCYIAAADVVCSVMDNIFYEFDSHQVHIKLDI